MSFYDNLKDIPPYEPPKPHTQEDDIRDLMQQKHMQSLASKAMDYVEMECVHKQRSGQRRLFGFFNCYADKWDSDGYSYIDPYCVDFHEWENGVCSTQRLETTTPPHDSFSKIYSYDSWTEQQALLRLLVQLMTEKGFPNGCASTYVMPIRYKEKKIAHSFWSGDKEYYVDHDYEVYKIEVDIRW